MKIGEWDDIGRSRAVVQRALGELNANERATFVTTAADSGKQRILVATNLGVFDFTWAPDATTKGVWNLRGWLTRWSSVRGFRLQADGQWNEAEDTAKGLWHVICEEPRLEFAAATGPDASPAAIALLDFAQACLAALD